MFSQKFCNMIEDILEEISLQFTATITVKDYINQYQPSQNI
jgi:hypothetical protein